MIYLRLQIVQRAKDSLQLRSICMQFFIQRKENNRPVYMDLYREKLKQEDTPQKQENKANYK